MTKATIKVEFVQQSKAVVANTKVELEGELTDDLKKQALQEAKDLFDRAYNYAKDKTING